MTVLVTPAQPRAVDARSSADKTRQERLTKLTRGRGLAFRRWQRAIVLAEELVNAYTGAHDMSHRDEVLDAVHRIETNCGKPRIVARCRAIFGNLAAHPTPAH